MNDEEYAKLAQRLLTILGVRRKPLTLLRTIGLPALMLLARTQ